VENKREKYAIEQKYILLYPSHVDLEQSNQAPYSYYLKKRGNLPVGCLRLSPHLAAETVIEMAGISPEHTHTSSS